MYQFQRGNPGFVPQQEQPSAPHAMASTQSRRPLAIDELLNEVSPRHFHRDERSRIVTLATNNELLTVTSHQLQPSYPYPPQPPPPMQTPYAQPQDTYNPYPPATMYQNSPYMTPGYRVELPDPPPNEVMGRWSDTGYNDWYMSHPRVTDPSRTLPGLNFPAAPDLAALEAQPGIRWERRTCVLCLEKFEGTDARSDFPYQCKRCTSGDFCAECLKDWFLDASKNESKMPPKCGCSAVPLSAVATLLTGAQIQLYKAKYEEWATPDRLYCPRPKCSTFIPQRMYIKIRQQPAASLREARAVDTLSPTLLLSFQDGRPIKDIKPRIACPACGTSVCTKCKSLSHFGECSQNDLDPVLEEQLKKWKIKRCPKCRAGVRRMYGCSHIECRCGAHFCWECMLPINQCGGSCDDEASDAEPESQVEEDDLDGNAGYYEGGGPDFGPEPYGHIVDVWGCQHVWSLVFPTSASAVGRRHLECNRCFRVMQPSGKSDTPPKLTFDEDIEMTGMVPSSPTDSHGRPLWQCFSRHIFCSRCTREAPSSRNGDPSRLWTCDCGIQCLACDKHEAMVQYGRDQKHAQEQKDKTDALAWECRCGTILCGACKVLSVAA